jgi:hypothetical protein
MARVVRHLGTLRPRSASVATGSAFSDDEGFSDDIRIDELTNGLIRLSVGAGHADLEQRELAKIIERLGLAPPEASPELVELAYVRGLREGRAQRLELREAAREVELERGNTAERPRELEVVDVEYEEPDHEKKR